MMNKWEQQDEAAQALREAVNAAVKTGISLEGVRAIVQDQLFGIRQLGKGDPDVLKQVSAEMDEELRQKWDKFSDQ